MRKFIALLVLLVTFSLPQVGCAAFGGVEGLVAREVALTAAMAKALDNAIDAYRHISQAVGLTDTELLVAQNAMYSAPDASNNGKAYKALKNSTKDLVKRITHVRQFGTDYERQRLAEALKYAKAKQQECYLCYAAAVPLGISLAADAVKGVSQMRGWQDIGAIAQLISIAAVGNEAVKYYKNTMKFFKKIDVAAQTARQATGVIPEKDTKALRRKQQEASDIGDEIGGEIGSSQSAISSESELEKQMQATKHLNAGSSFFSQDNYQEAARELTQCIALTPSQHEAYLLRAAAFNKLGRNEEALVDCDKFIKYKPTYNGAYKIRGDIYDALGKYALAIENYTKANKMGMHNCALYYNRGKTYFTMGKYPEAIEDFRKSISIQKDFTEGYIALGKVLSKSGKLREAISYLNTALTYAPNSLESLLMRASAAKELGEAAQARADCEQVLNASHATEEELTAARNILSDLGKNK